MTAEQTGEAIGHFLFALFVVVIVVGGVAWAVIAGARSSRAPAQQHAANNYWIAVFGLLPGEALGPVWQAAHSLGHPMVATITSTGVFALNYSAPQAPPLRMPPDGVTVASGPARTVTAAPGEPMVKVTLSIQGQAPVSFLIAQSGAHALASWARPTP